MSEHGTVSAYIKQHCRCEPCRQAMSDYMRAYRKANRDYFDRLNTRRREESAAKNGKPVRPPRNAKPEPTKTVFTDRQLEIAMGVQARMNTKGDDK